MSTIKIKKLVRTKRLVTTLIDPMRNGPLAVYCDYEVSEYDQVIGYVEKCRWARRYTVWGMDGVSHKTYGTLAEVRADLGVTL